jgi:hypothetical protein
VRLWAFSDAARYITSIATLQPRRKDGHIRKTEMPIGEINMVLFGSISWKSTATTKEATSPRLQPEHQYRPELRPSKQQPDDKAYNQVYQSSHMQPYFELPKFRGISNGR